MKKTYIDMIKYSAAALAAVLTALSCSGFLEETSQDEIKPSSANASDIAAPMKK